MFTVEGPGGDMLPTGVHRWAFSFHLPRGLPSSCIVPGGGVNYTMKAVVDIPWGFNRDYERAFMILKRIDINIPQLQVSMCNNIVLCQTEVNTQQRALKLLNPEPVSSFWQLLSNGDRIQGLTREGRRDQQKHGLLQAHGRAI